MSYKAISDAVLEVSIASKNLSKCAARVHEARENGWGNWEADAWDDYAACLKRLVDTQNRVQALINGGLRAVK